MCDCVPDLRFLRLIDLIFQHTAQVAWHAIAVMVVNDVTRPVEAVEFFNLFRRHFELQRHVQLRHRLRSKILSG